MSPGDGERAALRRDALYRAMFEANTALKLVIDPDDARIVDANPAAVEFYGWPLEVLCTMRVTDINIAPPEVVRASVAAARSLERRYFRVRHRTARGEIRAVEVHSGPFVVDGKALLFSVLHDVTEREELEEQLRLGQRLEAVYQLAGGVAHDFNNLLTVVITATQLARNRLPAEHDAQRFLLEVDAAARRGAALTRHLLAFSRRQTLALRPLAIDDVIAHLAPLLERALGPAHPVVLRVGAVDPVLADPSQLEQVVMNLVLNARDALPGGGPIELTIAPSAGGERGVPAGRWVRLDVTDHGVGMDEATRRRAMEPFFTTKPVGTGIGLASVHGIVAQSGGHVVVASAPGAGTTCSVFLPVTEQPVAAEPPPAAAPAPRAITVLVVDDLEAVRHTIGAMLRDAGHEALVASSYDDALAAVADRLGDVDLVLTDAVMPGRGGDELIATLRARRPDLPCVLMTGDLRAETVAALPPDVVRLSKPFALDTLAAVIAGLVG